MADKKSKQKATFVLDVRFMQHGSWQGTLKWLEEKKTYTFRSALEMIRIVDDIASKGYEVEMPKYNEGKSVASFLVS